MEIVCIIPARFSSMRFPGKPLARIAGSPMIEWVYRRAASVPEFDQVIVATDDRRIADTVAQFGGQSVMTPVELNTGTDRVAFAAREINADVVVNLQGDEPLISPDLLSAICHPYTSEEVVMTTPVKPIHNREEFLNPNLARVIIDRNGDAIYFSRAQIPYVRDSVNKDEWYKLGRFYRHIGLYSYRKDFLLHLASLPAGETELLEQLEQIRVLEYGFKIRTVLTDYTSISVDVPGDLEMVETYIKKHKISVDGSHETM